MSYILEALRKADAERERGAVPGLHTAAAATPPSPAAMPAASPLQRALPWVSAVLGLIVVVLLSWLWFGSLAAPNGPAAPMANQPAPPEQPGQAVAGQTPPMTPPMTQPMTPPVLTAPAPHYAYPPAGEGMAGGTGTAHASPSPSPAEPDRLYKPQDLPESIRREWPTIAVGGAMYAEVPANRILIVNTQVLHEGDKLQADLVLEEIKLKSAVFRFKGHRVAVSY